jgi:DNA-binding LacI/PurR family transcriptional regulator
VLVSESQLADDPAKGVSGAVVIGGYLSEATAAFLKTIGVPAVMIASPSSEPNISSVQVDVIEGVRRATAYLHELGHRRVALLNGPSATLASDHKLTGYLRALYDRGIAPDPDLILSLERDVTGSRTIVLEALSGALQGVTGVICAYEELAIATLQAGREIGIRVPDDLSIIAYHDEGLAEVAVPPLTTIALPIELMARLAVSQLVTLAYDPDLVGTQLLVKAALRVRGSTATART